MENQQGIKAIKATRHHTMAWVGFGLSLTGLYLVSSSPIPIFFVILGIVSIVFAITDMMQSNINVPAAITVALTLMLLYISGSIWHEKILAYEIDNNLIVIRDTNKIEPMEWSISPSIFLALGGAPQMNNTYAFKEAQRIMDNYDEDKCEYITVPYFDPYTAPMGEEITLFINNNDDNNNLEPIITTNNGAGKVTLSPTYE